MSAWHASKIFILNEDVQLLEDWLVQTPALSITELLLREIKNNVLQRKPRSPQELWNYCQEEWGKITSEKI